MRLNPISISLIAMAMFLGSHEGVEAKNAPAQTTVLTGGQIYTAHGWETAVAYRDGKIVAVGSDAQVRSRVGSAASEIPLKGRTVFPGLYDMHVHPLSAGTLMVQCRFAQGAVPNVILETIAQCVQQHKPGEWIAGGQWQNASFGSTPPTRQMLDAISPNNPVILKDVSGHSLWVNSLALKLAGVTRETRPPVGGIIERDANGEPTGILREAALAMVRKAVPPLSPEQNSQAIERALNTLVSLGVTAVTDAGATQDMVNGYRDLARAQRILPHVRACILYGKFWSGSGSFDDLFEHREEYRSAHFNPDCVKLLVDGVPTEGHTAMMLEPYVDTDHGVPGLSKDTGSLQVPQEELNAVVAKIDKLGVLGKFHSVGDGTSRAVLDAISLARKANGPNGPHHDIAHVTFIAPSDIQRARKLGVNLEFSPYMWFASAINDDITKAVGAERIKRSWPVREAIAAGALVDIGSDWPSGGPSPSPWVAMETLVTRRPPGDTKTEQFGGGEAITLKQAVDMFTVDGARQMGRAGVNGTIEVGQPADLIILDRNPFRVPITDVHNVQVEQTIIDGAAVYTSAR